MVPRTIERSTGTNPFLSRVGIDLLSQEEVVFQPAGKLIGREPGWSEIVGFFSILNHNQKNTRKWRKKFYMIPPS